MRFIFSKKDQRLIYMATHDYNEDVMNEDSKDPKDVFMKHWDDAEKRFHDEAFHGDPPVDMVYWLSQETYKSDDDGVSWKGEKLRARDARYEYRVAFGNTVGHVWLVLLDRKLYYQSTETQPGERH